MNGALLLHGWGLNRCVWQPLSAALPAGCAAHRLDLPGYGCASVEPYDLKTLAETALQMAPPQALWLGSSLGGMVALQAALLQPQRVTRLVLVGVTPRFVSDSHWQHGTDPQVFAQFAERLAADFDQALDRFLLLQAGHTGRARSLVRELSRTMSTCGRPGRQVLLDGLQCLKDADLRPHLSKIACPVHVIQGSMDRVTPPAAAEYLVEQISHAKLDWLPSGHLPFVSHLPEFLALLQEDLCN